MNVNVDGSFDDTNKKGGIGMIMRDDGGNPITTACAFLNRCCTALEAELLAIKDGITFALQWTFRPIVLESDCLTAIQMINSKERCLSELAFVVREVRDLMNGDREILLRKIHRSQNHASHSLANKARAEPSSIIWLNPNCDDISQIVKDDFIPE